MFVWQSDLFSSNGNVKSLFMDMWEGKESYAIYAVNCILYSLASYICYFLYFVFSFDVVKMELSVICVQCDKTK